MRKKILVLGATGLVGTECIEQLLKSDRVDHIYILARREIERSPASQVTQIISDFTAIEDDLNQLSIDSAICTLGTTIKQAKSEASFYRVEHDIPLRVATVLKHLGCHHFIYLSSVGASESSKNFYLQTKGKIESDLAKLDFLSTSMVRPSLLLGKRNEFRLGEAIGKMFAAAFRWCIPKRYQAISSYRVATKLVTLATSDQVGLHRYENEDIG